MLSFDLGEINWLAVLVAAVAAFFVGGLWYGMIFANAWVRLGGFTEDQQKSMARKQGRNFAIFFVLDLLLASVLAILVANVGAATAAHGLVLGATLWLGFTATIGISRNAANDRPVGMWLIDTGYELAMLCVMGIIIGAWR